MALRIPSNFIYLKAKRGLAVLKVRVIIEDFRIDYNTRRPHSRLGYRSPVNYAGYAKPMTRPDFAPHRTLLRGMAGKYIWWQKPEELDDRPERVIAQVLRFAAGGEGEEMKHDQALLECEIGRDALRYVILNAEPGWFPEHAWRHWHTYLNLVDGAEIPPLPQRRLPL